MDGASHIVADLHTSNGTFVNGARVSRHQLRPGDVVELGPARVQFRQESESPKGKNVRFASQLKSFTPFGSDDEESGNRTMMGLPGAQGLVSAQGDYSERSPQGEIEFDLGSGGATGNTPAAVVDLDSVLDGALDGIEIASFEDEELTNLEKDPDELPPGGAARAPGTAAGSSAGAARAGSGAAARCAARDSASAARAAPAPAPAPRAAAPAQAPRPAAAAAARRAQPERHDRARDALDRDRGAARRAEVGRGGAARTGDLDPAGEDPPAAPAVAGAARASRSRRPVVSSPTDRKGEGR